MDNLLEFLAEGSHKGWMAEKQRQGFADHVFIPRNIGWEGSIPTLYCIRCGETEDKHHTDMLPYSELPEHVKEYDRATVRGVLRDLAAYFARLAEST